MSYVLAGALRLETAVTAGRLLTRVYLDDRELSVDRNVLVGLTTLAAGGRPTQEQLAALARAGVLRPEGIEPPARPRLAAGTAVDFIVRGALVAGTRRSVVPETSYPISLFVPPEILDVLQPLAAELREAHRRMVGASISRGRLPDAERAAAILAAIAEEQVRRSRRVAAVVEVEPAPFRLRPRVPLQRAELQYSVELRFRRDRGGEPVLAHVLRADELAAASRLIGALVKGAPLPSPPPPLLLGLARAGLLEEAAVAPPGIDVAPGEVLHLGHATLLANLGGARVLIDPWLPPPSSADGDRRPPAVPDLPPLDAVLFTHHHWDHVHPETLLKLDKDLPLYIPKQPEGHALVPRTDRLLAALGFTRIHALAAGDSIALGEGLVTALPFHGEDPTRIGYAGACYLLEMHGGAALVHVDSGTDATGASLVTSGEIDRQVRRRGPLTTVFASRRQERGLMIDHTWEFLFQPVDQWVRPTENCCNDAAFLAALASAAGARDLVLYSEGGADWYPDGTDFLRKETPSARSAPFEHEWDSLDEIRARVEATGASLVLSRPFDRYRICPY